MTPDDARAATHLSRLGVNPATTAQLVQYAEADEMTLREFVAYVLSDYHPATDARTDDDEADSREGQYTGWEIIGGGS